MSKSKKIIISIIIVILIISAGFAILQKPGRTEGSSNDNSNQNHSALEHLIRPILNGGVPGDGGGG